MVLSLLSLPPYPAFSSTIFPSLFLLVSTQDTAYDMYKTTYVLKHRVDMMIPFHGPLCLPFLECASLQRHDFLPLS